MYPLVMNVPLSPPETNATLGPAHGSQSYRPLAHGPGSVSGVHDSASVAGPALRRQPSIFYNNSPGFNRGETRERASSAASKLLVIVVPPVSVTQEHGTLGHTLACGPSHRLPQGIVMPLFPNMYGQMTAIAKEFNFPSITGLCLYYCFSDGEFSMTPRLSEDIWSTMWGLPEAASQPRDRRPPIVGRLEFDIDMAKARWYGAWLSSRQRETAMEFPLYQGPVTAPSVHFRGDSRFAFPHSVMTDDISEPVQPHHSAPVAGRHVPRKLSLVERFDVQSSHGTDNGVQELRLPSGLPLTSVLSPIKQLEEPKSARAELDNKVNTWRATAVASPVPIEASVPHESLIEPSTPSEVPIRMEDFQWSISSAGPDDSASVHWGPEVYEPSIHLADRANGSVASTVSYCTSNGPSDYAIWFSMLDSRVASPDIAHRMFEDVPPSPMTATSWGAPTHYSASIHSDEYAPSIDLGHRAEFSRPITPMTATSWGASTGPSSPLSPYRVTTPDIAQRGFEDVAQMVLQRWPGRPWRHAWPYNSRTERKEEGQVPNKASRWVPVISKVIQRKKTHNTTSVVHSGTGYPHFDLYPAVPAKASQPELHGYPHNLRLIYPSVAPSTKLEVTSSRAQQYPHFELYAAVYPFNLDRIYLQEAGALVKAVQPSAITVVTKSQYPTFELYPAGYPFSLNYIYAPVRGVAKPTPTGSQLKVVEKVLESWRPWRHAWPYNVRKAPVVAKSSRWAGAISKVIKSQKHARASTVPAPTKASPPAVVRVGVSSQRTVNGYPHNLRSIYPPVSRSPSTSGASRSQYPHFEIYAPVYPYNLDAIYPVAHRTVKIAASRALVKSAYPLFEIYPAVYPFFNLYPGVAARLSARQGSKPALRFPTISTSGYPYFTLYPTTYPHFDLYPTIAGGLAPSNPRCAEVRTTGYPHFTLYPPVYPHFELYPAIAGQCLASKPKPVLASSSVTGYPHFALYPPVYPHFDLYPTVAGSVKLAANSERARSGSPTAGYPHFVLYPPVYPHFNLYPSFSGSLATSRSLKRTEFIARGSGYPSFNIYPAVYPHFNLYPSIACSRATKDRQRGVAVTLQPGYPFIALYPPVYPHLVLYPSLTRIAQRPSLPPPATIRAAPAPSLKKAVSFQVEKPRPKSGRLTHAELHAMVIMEGSRGKMGLDEVSEIADSFPSVPQTKPSVPRTVSAGRSRAPSISANRPQPPPLQVPSSSRDHGSSSSPEHNKPLPLRRHPFPTESIRPTSVYRGGSSSSSSNTSPVTPPMGGMSRSNSVAVRPRPRPPTSVPMSQRRSMWEALPPPSGPLPTRPLTVVSKAGVDEPRRRDSIVSHRVKTYTTAASVPASGGGGGGYF